MKERVKSTIDNLKRSKNVRKSSVSNERKSSLGIEKTKSRKNSSMKSSRV